MKLKNILTEYGYLMVMGLCLACSAALLISVTMDKPIVAIAREHVPVLRTEKAVQEGEHTSEIPLQEETVKQEGFPVQTTGFLLTEDALEEQLGAFLPENFPAEDLDVSFEGGMLGLSFDMSRAKLKSYLKEQGVDLGIKRDLLLQMLPRQVELEGVFAVSADQSGLHLTPVMLTEKIIPGVVAIAEGAWHEADKEGRDIAGSMNVLTSQEPTPLAKGNPQHTNLVEVKKIVREFD